MAQNGTMFADPHHLKNVMIYHNTRTQGDMIYHITRKSEKGYIALVSALLLTVVLLVFTVAVSLSGYYSRSNVLGSEVKEQSSALAEACVNKAAADVAIGNPVAGTVSFGSNPYDSGNPYMCDIVSVGPHPTNAGETQIKARGVYLDSYTNLVVDIDSDTQNVVLWREHAVMP